ncbi:YciI family protein [Edaphobacter aggregans]|uniref:YciI family protein n=1 Tax=Edaphobacter aggregans TaxID=570835 RepID=UPI00054E5E23|nr:YciI family protein [Edaphobacter aggregans]
MRFMIIRKSDSNMETGALPDNGLLAAVGRYYQDMRDAGVLLAGEWLRPTASSARIVATQNKQTVIDGPFTELKELIAGFILIEVPSLEEAIRWARRCPTLTGAVDAQAEIRQVLEASDFPADCADPLTLHASKQIATDAEKLLHPATTV